VSLLGIQIGQPRRQSVPTNLDAFIEYFHGYFLELGQSMETNGTKSAQFNKIDSTAHILKVPIKYLSHFFQENVH
jgi:hypothetical protein